MEETERVKVETTTRSYFWAEIPHNTLAHPHKVSHKTQHYWRVAAAIFTVLTTIWCFVDAIIQGNVFKLFAYLTIWGVFITTTYFVCIHIYKNAPHDSYGWKFTYLVGEMAFCLEFLIAPFFWIILYPIIMHQLDIEQLLFNISIHLICSIFIWVEIAMNHMKFPHSHRIILGVMGAIYVVDNYLWSTISGKPIYPPIDWKSPKCFILLGVALVMAFAGYEVGRWQSRKKMVGSEHLPLTTETAE